MTTVHLKELPEEELRSQPSAWMRQLVQQELTRLVEIHSLLARFYRCNPQGGVSNQGRAFGQIL